VPDLPVIACTLTPDELPRRAAEIGALARDALVRAERPSERSLVLHFEPGAATLARVEALVDAESRCCAFLEFEIERRHAETALTITAPPGAEPVLESFAGFSGL
jgi:hypothetical protein